MRSVGGMPGYCRLENDAGFGISVATELVELGDVLLEQATLGFRRYLLFHDADDIVAQLLAGDVGRKITLVCRKGAGGCRGNPERRSAVVCASPPRSWASPSSAYDHAATAPKWQRACMCVSAELRMARRC